MKDHQNYNEDDDFWKKNLEEESNGCQIEEIHHYDEKYAVDCVHNFKFAS